MSKLTGKGLMEHSKTKIGTPYVYGAKGQYGKFTQSQLDSLVKSYPGTFTAAYIAKAKRFVGQVCTDCSGLISWYTGKLIGSAQMYSNAKERNPLNRGDLSKVPIGAVLWRSGHVGVYIGNGELIEAKGIDYGTVKSKVASSSFTHWLLFKELEYDAPSTTANKVKSPNKATGTTTKKAKNPHKEPTTLVKKGSRGEGVKWVQFELREAGYMEVKIDGDYGPITETFVKCFQQSCKVAADGIVGPVTRKHFKLN